MVETLFTVDRCGKLREGMLIPLTKYANIKSNMLVEHVNALFPNGLSRHGERYLIAANSKAQCDSPNIELFFEYARRAFFADRVSRFQSLFACGTLADAQLFRSEYKGEGGDSPIFEVIAQGKHFKGNMRLLNRRCSILEYSYRAHDYWSGRQGLSDTPFWEFMLELPVKIGRRVD